MQEKFFDTGDGKIFYRSSEYKSKPTVLMIHGIGESGISFIDSIDYLQDFNLIIPDLPGFGRSEHSSKNDYSFDSQISKLWDMIDSLEMDEIYLIGHSYGGMLATLMCKNNHKGKIKKFLNIEGTISESNIFISLQAKAAYENPHINFKDWLFHQAFKDFVLSELNYSSAIKYFESVRVCDPQAFAQTAIEICEKSRAAGEDNISQIGYDYRDLGDLPRVYCFGTKSSKMESAKRFLNESSLHNKGFSGTHWLMLEQSEEFYNFAKEFVSS